MEPGLHVVALADLFALVDPVNPDEPWDSMITSMLDDPIERLVIDDLAAQLTRDGKFAQPIRVDDGQMGNGCHRVCATVLAGKPDIEVFAADDDHPYPYPDPDACDLRFAVTPTDGRFRDGDEFMETAMTAARSLPVGDRWFEADTCTGTHQDTISLFFYCTLSEAPAVAAAVVDRLAVFGVTATHLDTELVMSNGVFLDS